jgi:uncharacterized membrane protein
MSLIDEVERAWEINPAPIYALAIGGAVLLFVFGRKVVKQLIRKSQNNQP